MARPVDTRSALPHRALDEVTGRQSAGVADPKQEVLHDLRAAPRVHDLRMNCTRTAAWCDAGTRLPEYSPLRASTSQPAGATSTRSPCDIHTGVLEPGAKPRTGLRPSGSRCRRGRIPSRPPGALRRPRGGPGAASRSNPEHGNVQLEQRGVGGRGVEIVDGAGTAREDDARGGKITNPTDVPRRRVDLAVNVGFAHPPGDQLRVLRTRSTMRMRCAAITAPPGPGP